MASDKKAKSNDIEYNSISNEQDVKDYNWSIKYHKTKIINRTFSDVDEGSINVQPLAIEVTNPINKNSYTDNKNSVMYYTDGSKFYPDNDEPQIPMSSEEVWKVRQKLDHVINNMQDIFSHFRANCGRKFALSTKDDFDNVTAGYLSSGLIVRKGFYNYESLSNIKVTLLQKTTFYRRNNRDNMSSYLTAPCDNTTNMSNKVGFNWDVNRSAHLKFIMTKMYIPFWTVKNFSVGTDNIVSYAHATEHGWDIPMDLFYDDSYTGSIGDYLFKDWLATDGEVDVDTGNKVTLPLRDNMSLISIVNNDLNYNIEATGRGYTKTNNMYPNTTIVRNNHSSYASHSAYLDGFRDNVYLCSTGFYYDGYIYYVNNNKMLCKVSITAYDFIPIASFINDAASSNIGVHCNQLTIDAGSSSVQITPTAWTQAWRNMVPNVYLLEFNYANEVKKFMVDAYMSVEFYPGEDNGWNSPGFEKISCENTGANILSDALLSRYDEITGKYQ